MEPQRHEGPGQHIQPPYPPQQHISQNPHQYPQYGPSQQWGQPQPKKKGKLGWILGGIGIALIILLFAGCAALVSNINGGGGSHADKMASMRASIDKVPEAGWTETHRYEKKVEPGCLSIDTHCIRMDVEWVVDHEVTIDEVASRLGKDIEDFDGGGNDDCLKTYDSASSTLICVDDKSDGRYNVRINMTRK